MVREMNWDLESGQLKKRSVSTRYLFAVLVVILAWLVREMSFRVSHELPLIGMPYAVFFAAYFGGVGPGLFATILAVLVTAYHLPPEHSWHVESYVDQLRLVSFLGLGILISLLSERARRMQVRAAANELALSESRYLTLIYQSPEPILVLREGIIRILNTPMVLLLGPIRRQGLLNEPLIDFVHPDDKELIKLWLSEMRPGATARSPARVRFVRLDGQIIEAMAAAEVFESAAERSVQITLSEARSLLIPTEEPPARQETLLTVAR
jgi:K+-sensing histidine kinase KdpD